VKHGLSSAWLGTQVARAALGEPGMPNISFQQYEQEQQRLRVLEQQRIIDYVLEQARQYVLSRVLECPVCGLRFLKTGKRKYCSARCNSLKQTRTYQARHPRLVRRTDMAHKGQVGEPKGGSMGGKPTDMKTVKSVATSKGCK